MPLLPEIGMRATPMAPPVPWRKRLEHVDTGDGFPRALGSPADVARTVDWSSTHPQM